MTQDTYSGNAYEPWKQHLYAYTGNNPTNFVDPTGHESELTSQIRNNRDSLISQRGKTLKKYYRSLSKQQSHYEQMINSTGMQRMMMMDTYIDMQYTTDSLWKKAKSLKSRIKEYEKALKHSIAKDIINEGVKNGDIKGTFTTFASWTSGAGGGKTVSDSFAIDLTGTIQIQTMTGDYRGTPTGSVVIGSSISEAPIVDKLNGTTNSRGGTASWPVPPFNFIEAGAEIQSIGDEEYFGLSVFAGVDFSGLPASFYETTTQTSAATNREGEVVQINILDTFVGRFATSNLPDWIMD